MRHRTCTKATDATSAKTSNATAAKATHVGSAKAAAHVAAAESATAVSSATATATAGLRTRSKQAAGEHCACQNHHHSSSHDILHRNGRTFPPQVWVRRQRLSQQDERRRRDGLEIGMLAGASTKLHFNQPALFRDPQEVTSRLLPRTRLPASSDPRKPKFVFS
jgi:hypothetical protein